MASLLPGGDLVDERARERDAGRDRQPGARRRSQPGCLRAEARLVVARRRAGRPRSRVDRHFTGVAVDPHARAVGDAVGRVARADHAGDAVLARHDRRVREQTTASVTIAPSSGSRMLNASVVDSVTSTSPCTMRSNSAGPETRRAGPSYTPPLAARPRSRFSSCARLRAAEQLAHRDADRVHDPRRRPAGGPTGRAAGAAAARATAAPPWRCASCGRRSAAASSSADGPPAPVTSAHISSKPASTKCSASWTRPLSSSRRPAASTARRMMPDAQMSLKTPRSSRRRYMRRASPSSSSNSARCSSGTCERMSAMRASTSSVSFPRAVDRRADRAQQRVGQLERVAPGDVEAVEQPAADEVEVLRHRRRRHRRRTRAARRASCRGRRRSRGARERPRRS